MFPVFQAITGPLPAGFLRLQSERELQESADRQAAIALYQQQNAAPYLVSPLQVIHVTRERNIHDS